MFWGGKNNQRTLLTHHTSDSSIQQRGSPAEVLAPGKLGVGGGQARLGAKSHSAVLLPADSPGFSRGGTVCFAKTLEFDSNPVLTLQRHQGALDCREARMSSPCPDCQRQRLTLGPPSQSVCWGLAAMFLAWPLASTHEPSRVQRPGQS